jgi:hypothetical protein
VTFFLSGPGGKWPKAEGLFEPFADLANPIGDVFEGERYPNAGV